MSNIIPAAKALDDQAFRMHIVAIARQWLGTPYRHRASVKSVGADCLGLLRGVYAELYGKQAAPVPAYTPDWGETPKPDGSFDELLLNAAKLYLISIPRNDYQAGNVALFRMFAHSPIKHCAILTARDSMIHAYSEHQVCEIYFGSWWRRHCLYVFSFPPLKTP